MVRTVLREPAGSRTLSTLEAFVVLSFSSVGGWEVVRVFGEEIVCANIVFADGLTHVVAAFFLPFSVSKQGLMGDFKWCSWFCFQFVCSGERFRFSDGSNHRVRCSKQRRIFCKS